MIVSEEMAVNFFYDTKEFFEKHLLLKIFIELLNPRQQISYNQINDILLQR
jgi:hypothetical protein